MASHIARKYGQKKKKRTLAPIVVAEPHRKSLYQVITTNMDHVKRVTFIHRLVIIGEHTFSPGELNNIALNFRDNIMNINSTYHEEFLTGFLLHYAKYFMHVLDGCEEALNEHVNHLFTDEECVEKLGRLKLLCAYHHINQRFLTVWTELNAKPPHLLQKINPDLECDETRIKIENCISKLYRLGIKLRQQVTESESETTETTSSEGGDVFVGGALIRKVSSMRRSISKVKSTMSNFQDMGKPANCLPEQQLLEFLFETPYTQDLAIYAQQYKAIPSIKSYKEKCWPLITDFVPQDIFYPDYDPVTDIDKEEQMEESLAMNLEDEEGDV